MLGPALDKYLDHYQQIILFKSIIPGSKKWAHLSLDYRNTLDPVIKASHADFFILGDFYYHKKWDFQKEWWAPLRQYYTGHGCEDFSPKKLEFKYKHDT